MTFSQPNAWVADHMRADFDLTGFPPGARVLDIGCGCGKNLDALTQKGVRANGIDPDASAVEYCRQLGLPAEVGSAEALPAANDSLDGCLLDQVIQFTDVPVALREIHRVLRPGGCVLIATQGAGYALYTMISRQGKGRLFGLRVMVNAAMFRLFGKRLPGWWGDSLAFTANHLSHLIRTVGFEVEATAEGRRFGTLGTFIYVKACKSRAQHNNAVDIPIPPPIDLPTTCAE